MYEEGQNISLIDTLLDIARNHFPAWNVQDLRQYLEKDEGATRVQQEITVGRRRYGISGVPFFIIDGEGMSQPYGVSGAQSSSTLLSIFDEVAQEMEDA